MTDKKWVIICDCAWCNGEGETYGNDPSEKADESRECDGDEYENEEEVREDYKSKDIIFLSLVDRAWGVVDRAWGSPTTSME